MTLTGELRPPVAASQQPLAAFDGPGGGVDEWLHRQLQQLVAEARLELPLLSLQHLLMRAAVDLLQTGAFGERFVERAEQGIEMKRLGNQAHHLTTIHGSHHHRQIERPAHEHARAADAGPPDHRGAAAGNRRWRRQTGAAEP